MTDKFTLNTIAILPLGATEQHGPHLPADTDWIIAEALAARLADRLPASIKARVLPVERLGYSIEHADSAATHSLSYDEAIERWIAIGRDVAERGGRKLLLLNAHGGNSPLMTIVATELRVRHAMLAVATSWTRFAYPAEIVSPEEKALGIHGGFVETSVMLALRPDLVMMDKARHFPSAQAEFARRFTHLRAYGPHAFGWMMRDLSTDGVVGNAAAATAQSGERIIDNAVEGLLELCLDMDAFDASIFDAR